MPKRSLNFVQFDVRFKANTAERGVPGISDLLFSSANNGL